MSAMRKKLKYLAVTSVVTTEVKAKVCEIFENDDPAQLAATPIDDICERLEASGFNPDDPNHPLPDIAEAVVARLGGAPAPATTPNLSKEGGEGGLSKLAGVLGEALAGKKQLHEYSTEELLDMLIAGKFGKFQINEVFGAFRAKHNVGAAYARANGMIIVINANGSVRKDDTLAYIEQLQGHFARVREEYNGKEITTLDRAFKRSRMVAINYLTTPWRVEEIGSENEFGYDLGVLIDRFGERAKMVAWAAITEHETLQGLPTDKYGLKGIFRELFRETLEDDRFLDMRRAYKRAVGRGDVETQTIILRMTEEQAAERLQRSGYSAPNSRTVSQQRPAEPVHDTSYYEGLVRAHAELQPKNMNVGGNSQSRNGGICEYLYVSGNSCSVSGVVVLNGGSVGGNSCRADVYAPPRVSLSQGGNSTSVNVRNVPWKQLAEILGLIPRS